MCEHGDLAWMPELGPYGRYVDRCMVPLIVKVNKQTGLGACRTLASCCGHGKYPPTLIVKGNKTGIIFEVHTATTIPRTRNFYRMDEDGMYYLPEVM